MNGFLSNLDLIWNFIFSCLDRIYALLLASPILLAVFVLWLLDRIFNIFDLIKG